MVWVYVTPQKPCRHVQVACFGKDMSLDMHVFFGLGLSWRWYRTIRLGKAIFWYLAKDPLFSGLNMYTWIPNDPGTRSD